jgi:type 1 glutamine amidotransferase
MRRLFLLALLLVINPWRSDAADQPHIVMLIAEREYKTEQSLPPFAKQHLADYRVTYVYADPHDKHRLTNIEAVATADVLLVSVRRRTLPADQLASIRKHVAAGKPVIGIRTANHAFCLRGKDPPQGYAQWQQWDQEVFGGNYTNHYGNDQTATYRVTANAPEVLLSGIAADRNYTAGGSLYKVAPLATGTQIVLMGRVAEHPPEPVAWTFVRRDGGKSFYTSLGHVDDFAGDVLPKLLTNAIAWSLPTH